MIAIHERKGSFSDRWIKYCNINDVKYKLVNCYNNNIISEISDCKGLLWHWDQNDYKAQIFARELILSIENMGIKVFPNYNTCWHFDNKIAQKYLFESIGVPMINTYCFYSHSEALNWVNTTTFPKVFKLSGGAGSVNVKLVNNKNQARKLIDTAFKNGFNIIDKYNRILHAFKFFKNRFDANSLRILLSSFKRFFIKTELEKMSPRQKGYAYFQDFVENNDYDTRTVVIGNRCIAVRRYCRDGDFRASGSGIFSHDKNLFDEKMIEISFKIAKKLNTQSIAFDFIILDGKPVVIEISYCYIIGPFYDDCAGYWDENLKWYDEKVNMQNWIIEDFIKSIN